jgi:hypothetical protein
VQADAEALDKNKDESPVKDETERALNNGESTTF